MPTVVTAFFLFFCVLGGYFAVRPVRETMGTILGRDRVANLWLATWIVSRGMKSSTGISNAGLALGTITPALFLIFFMFAWLIDGKPSQVDYNGLSDLVPPVSGLSSIALVVGTFLAVWAASGAMSALIKAVNVAYDRIETRPFWKVRLISVLLVIVSGFVLAVPRR